MGFPNLFPQLQAVYFEDEEVEKKGSFYSALYVLCMLGSVAALCYVYSIEVNVIQTTVKKPTLADYLGIEQYSPTCACTKTSFKYRNIASVTNNTFLCDTITSAAPFFTFDTVVGLQAQAAMCVKAIEFSNQVMSLFLASSYSSVNLDSSAQLTLNLEDSLAALVATYRTIYSYPLSLMENMLAQNFPLIVYNSSSLSHIDNLYAVTQKRAFGSPGGYEDIAAMQKDGVCDCFQNGNWLCADYFADSFTRTCDAFYGPLRFDKKSLSKKWSFTCQTPTDSGYNDPACVGVRAIIEFFTTYVLGCSTFYIFSKGYVTFEDAFNDLFGISFASSAQYSSYFARCAPASCSYFSTRNRSPVEILTILLGLLGGLNAFFSGL